MNKYKIIFKELEQAIRSGLYQAGDLLPSESQLTAEYNVSRETIRKALVLLAQNGYIQKKQGKGSIVLPVQQFDFPISGLTSYKELENEQAMPTKTIVKKCELTTAHVENPLYPFAPKDKVWSLIRQREINGEVIILDKDYLLAELVPDMKPSIAVDSLFEYIENTLQLKIAYANKEFTVEPATPEDSQLMNLRPNDTFVVVVRSQVFLEDTRVFQYTESRHRVDKFKFIEFARRSH